MRFESRPALCLRTNLLTPSMNDDDIGRRARKEAPPCAGADRGMEAGESGGEPFKPN